MPIPLGILAVAGAGAAGGTYELIQSTILTGTQSDVTFSVIPTDYKHLQLRVVHRGANSNNNLSYWLQFNGDSGTNYAGHRLFGLNTSVTSDSFANQTEINLPYGAAATAGASQFGGSIVDILDYTNTTKNTTVRAFGGISGDYQIVGQHSGFWNNTAAITSIKLGSYGQNFVANSRFSLYGIRG